MLNHVFVPEDSHKGWECTVVASVSHITFIGSGPEGEVAGRNVKSGFPLEP